MLVWWLAFSRLPFRARLFGVACVILGGVTARLLADKSMGMGLLMYGMPVVLTAAVAWLLITRGAKSAAGWAGLAAITFLCWGYYTLIRVDGINGALAAERSWRWTPSAEDRFLAEQRQRLAIAKGEAQTESALPAIALAATSADWPEFRGAARDGHLRGVEIANDWSSQPPQKLWGRRVGPGWSSFTVIGEHVFTQEQRGEAEAVVCLDLTTGNERWAHEDQTRFWEVVAGAGPRGTPTFHEGQIYALGGGGRLNCLDAATGKVIWSRDLAADAETKPPQWGFASSPLVTQGVVVVFAGSVPDPSKKDPSKKEEKATVSARKTNGKAGVLAYDLASGEPRWTAGNGTHSYSSPQVLKVAGSEQVLMVTDHGLEAFEPATGKLLWEHGWYLEGMFRVCQPHVLGDSQVLLGTGMGAGTRLLTIAKEGEEWKVTENWTSKDLKPYFNDFVSHDGHLYGFDNEILACVEAATGKKKWKKGRYGHGQCLLVGERGRLVIISEMGEAVLAEISPAGLKELGKFQALTGKTWNHPVVAAGKLLVRNSEDMACYDLNAGLQGEAVASAVR
jgi:outer membrane protein assembly factor BamB